MLGVQINKHTSSTSTYHNNPLWKLIDELSHSKNSMSTPLGRPFTQDPSSATGGSPSGGPRSALPASTGVSGGVSYNSHGLRPILRSMI